MKCKMGEGTQLKNFRREGKKKTNVGLMVTVCEMGVRWLPNSGIWSIDFQRWRKGSEKLRGNNRGSERVNGEYNKG